MHAHGTPVSPARALTRRRVLQGAGVVGGAAALSPLLGGVALAEPPPAPEVLDWRQDAGTSPVNLLRDGRFRLWHEGTTRDIPASATSGVHLCGLWLGVPHTPAELDSQEQRAVATRRSDDGGVRLQITNPGVFYLRQYVFGSLDRLSGRTYTLSVDLEVERVTMVNPRAPIAQLRLDVYVQARFNRFAAERVLVTDTREQMLPSGRCRVVSTFVVPDVSGSGAVRDVWESLELAFRPIVPRGVREGVVTVHEAVLTEGTRSWSRAVTDDAGDRADLLRFFETGTVAAGPTGPVAQIRYRGRKWRKGSPHNTTVRDHLGNPGKVTAVLPLGILVPDVTPTIASSSAFLDGFTVSVPSLLVPELLVTGLAFTWRHDVF